MVFSAVGIQQLCSLLSFSHHRWKCFKKLRSSLFADFVWDKLALCLVPSAEVFYVIGVVSLYVVIMSRVKVQNTGSGLVSETDIRGSKLSAAGGRERKRVASSDMVITIGLIPESSHQSGLSVGCCYTIHYCWVLIRHIWLSLSVCSMSNLSHCNGMACCGGSTLNRSALILIWVVLIILLASMERNIFMPDWFQSSPGSRIMMV